MDDLRSEIRAAFQKEQAANPPTPDLRRNVVEAVAARPRRRPSLQWMAVAAAIVITALVVASLVSSRLALRGVPSHPQASPVAGDYGPPPAGVPLFYLKEPNHDSWYVGFDWTGKPRATIKAYTHDSGITLVQSPDGSAFQLAPGGKGGAGNLYVDRLGQNPTSGGGGIWADDNKHTCDVVLDQKNLTWTLTVGGPGHATQLVATLATESGVGQTGIYPVACSFKNDRAIAVRTSVAWPSETWVVRLSDGKVLAHRTIQNPNQLVNVTASPDASLIAENSGQWTGGPGHGAAFTVIRRASDGTVLTQLDPSMGVLAFSADDTMALVGMSPWVFGTPPHLAVLEVATGRIVTTYVGNEAYAGSFTEPNGTAFAVMFDSATGQAHPVVDVVILFADGRTVALPAGYLRP